MEKFEITRRKNGEYHFNLIATNGQVILSGEGYATKSGCLNGIESVRKNSIDPARYDILESKDGKTYFRLKSGNGQVVGVSEMYDSLAGMNNGIASVQRNAPKARIVDLTKA